MQQNNNLEKRSSKRANTTTLLAHLRPPSSLSSPLPASYSSSTKARISIYHVCYMLFFPFMYVMDLPTVLLPILEQGNRSLEDHTKDFMYLASMTHYPVSSIYSFYLTGLNPTTRAQLSGKGPRESLAAYVEWVLVSSRSSWTTEDNTSPTPDPESNQPSPRFMEHEPEPTVDGEPEPSVRELATEPATVDVPDGREGAEDSTAHCTTAEGEQRLDLGLIVLEQDLTNFVEDIYEDMPALLPPSKLPDNLEQDLTNFVEYIYEDMPALLPPSKLPDCLEQDLINFFEDVYEEMPTLLPPSKLPDNLEQDLINFFEDVYEDMPTLLPPSKLPDCLDFPPTLPLSIVSAASVPPPLSPGSPSAHPQPTISAVGLLQVCQSPSVLEDPSSPPPASESQTPPRSSDPAAPPRLSAPSSPPSPIGPPAPPGSLVPPAPPWSVVVPPSPQDSAPPALPRRSIPPAPLGSYLPPAPLLSSVAPVPPRTSGAPPPPRSPEPRAPPRPSGSSESPWTISSPSPPRAPPPPAPPPSVSPLESSALPPPWLLPPSAPPWVGMMAAVWVLHGSSCSGSLLSSPWLLPPSSPPWTLFIVLLPEVRPPPEPPPTMTLLLSHIHSLSTPRGRAFREGGKRCEKTEHALNLQPGRWTLPLGQQVDPYIRPMVKEESETVSNIYKKGGQEVQPTMA
ncbi:Filamentous hemagglutinin [Labeo rohita]|uniref:Filamentous hemagglutinin n=1 Tax=Labeo rohita TaxID=84645 RepID=A0ABQ8LIR8_LABRO|nr:Filamentous hemagglutinin [Labeo rohita]